MLNVFQIVVLGFFAILTMPTRVTETARLPGEAEDVVDCEDCVIVKDTGAEAIPYLPGALT